MKKIKVLYKVTNGGPVSLFWTFKHGDRGNVTKTLFLSLFFLFVCFFFWLFGVFLIFLNNNNGCIQWLCLDLNRVFVINREIF